METDSYSFPYVAAWAGEDGMKAVQATQARVAQAARRIIEASPAVHGAGGKPPEHLAADEHASPTGANGGQVSDCPATEIDSVGL